jgi:hypothetical protein
LADIELILRNPDLDHETIRQGIRDIATFELKDVETQKQ